MNTRRIILSMLTVVAVLSALALLPDSAVAQDQPGEIRRPALRGERDRERERDPQDRPRPEGPGMLEGPRQPGGPFGDGMGPRPLRPIGPGATADNLRNYLEMVDRYHQISKDPTAAGVAAVMSTVDVLRPRGAQAAIDYFTKLLPQVRSEAVSRAIRLQLVELYKATNQPEKALDLLEKLMMDAPRGTSGER